MLGTLRLSLGNAEARRYTLERLRAAVRRDGWLRVLKRLLTGK